MLQQSDMHRHWNSSRLEARVRLRTERTDSKVNLTVHVTRGPKVSYIPGLECNPRLSAPETTFGGEESLRLEREKDAVAAIRTELVKRGRPGESLGHFLVSIGQAF
jgi:hypothetical protein